MQGLWRILAMKREPEGTRYSLYEASSHARAAVQPVWVARHRSMAFCRLNLGGRFLAISMATRPQISAGGRSLSGIAFLFPAWLDGAA